MIVEWYNRKFGPVEWPETLVKWCTCDLDSANVKTIAVSLDVPVSLFVDYVRGPNGQMHRRWPSFDELIFRDLFKPVLVQGIQNFTTLNKDKPSSGLVE